MWLFEHKYVLGKVHLTFFNHLSLHSLVPGTRLKYRLEHVGDKFLLKHIFYNCNVLCRSMLYLLDFMKSFDLNFNYIAIQYNP